MKELIKLVRAIKKNYIYIIIFAILNITPKIIKNNIIPIFELVILGVIQVLNIILYKKVIEHHDNEKISTKEFLYRNILQFFMLTFILWTVLNLLYIPFNMFCKGQKEMGNLLFLILKIAPSSLYMYLISLSIPLLLYSKNDSISSFLGSVRLTIINANQLWVLALISLFYLFTNLAYDLVANEQLQHVIIKRLIINFLSISAFSYSLHKLDKYHKCD